jgi:hypothetical protein
MPVLDNPLIKVKRARILARPLHEIRVVDDRF